MEESEVTFSRLIGIFMSSVMLIIVTSIIAKDLTAQGLKALTSPMFIVEALILIMSVVVLVMMVAPDKSK